MNQPGARAVGDFAEREEWLFLGHTHRPFKRKIGKLTIVNPGSLGMPVDGDPRACYAVWEDGRVKAFSKCKPVVRRTGTANQEGQLSMEGSDAVWPDNYLPIAATNNRSRCRISSRTLRKTASFAASSLTVAAGSSKLQ